MSDITNINVKQFSRPREDKKYIGSKQVAIPTIFTVLHGAEAVSRSVSGEISQFQGSEDYLHSALFTWRLAHIYGTDSSK